MTAGSLLVLLQEMFQEFIYPTTTLLNALFRQLNFGLTHGSGRLVKLFFSVKEKVEYLKYTRKKNKYCPGSWFKFKSSC